MRAHELRPAPGSHRDRKRVGRGISAGQGKTSGRGQKGQGARSSVDVPRAFEGGQMPLSQRLPKLRGFHNFNRREFATVNLGKLNKFAAGTEVGPQLLLESGVIKQPLDGIKILGAGELKVALKVSAHRFSAGARRAIEAAGGSVELLEPLPEAPGEETAGPETAAPETAAPETAAPEVARPEAAAPAVETAPEPAAPAEAEAEAEAEALPEPAAETEPPAAEPAAEETE